MLETVVIVSGILVVTPIIMLLGFHISWILLTNKVGPKGINE